MTFFDLVRDLDAAVEATFSDFTSITIHPLGGGSGYDISVTQSAPQFQDDYIPGSLSGVSQLLLFVASGAYTDLAVKPVKGDTASLNGVDYDVVEVPVDRMGAATLKLRRRTKRWDL